MQLTRHRSGAVAADGGPAPDGVEVTVRETPTGFSWRVVNGTGAPVALRCVRAVLSARGVRGRVRMFSHGRSSSSRCGLLRPGVDVDPAAGALAGWSVAAHHADGRPAPADELRSELVVALADDDGGVVAGFLGGDLHDGTFRYGPGRTGNELVAEAFLGGAVLRAGEERPLHEVWLTRGDDPVGDLEGWSAEAGRRAAARVRGPHQVIWSSGPHLGGELRERTILAELDRAGQWPLDVFRVEGGLAADAADRGLGGLSFPSGPGAMAHAVASAGLRPGLGLAPFLAVRDAAVIAAHPDWLAGDLDGGPLVGALRGGGELLYVLDTSHPEVLEHLEALGAELVDLGFTHFSLAELRAPALPGRFHDPGRTPAQRVRLGLDALRRGVGDAVTLATTDAPLGPCIGAVDVLRTGPEAAGWFEPDDALWPDAGYRATVPAVRNAWRNAMGRAHQHRRLWQGDPGRLHLRTGGTELDEAQLHGWARLVAATGGPVTVSDHLGEIPASGRRLLEEVIAVGRRVDAAARAAGPPRCEDLLTAATPTTLAGPEGRFVGDSDRGAGRWEGS
ncbi:MAG: hypothetical protein ACOYOP_06595 [Microthrixaceae bacterium]